MATVTIRYQGDLSCVAQHEVSGTQLQTDAPKDNEGLGRSFSPTDLVATALGTCMATIMGIYARRHDLDLEGMTVAVTKEMADAPRRISGLPVIITMPRAVAERHREALRRAAESCPVHRSLDPAMNKPIDIVYPEA